MATESSSRRSGRGSSSKNSQLGKSLQKFRIETFWNCCYCGLNGPGPLAMWNSQCPICTHQRCAYYQVEEVKIRTKGRDTALSIGKSKISSAPPSTPVVSPPPQALGTSSIPSSKEISSADAAPIVLNSADGDEIAALAQDFGMPEVRNESLSTSETIIEIEDVEKKKKKTKSVPSEGEWLLSGSALSMPSSRYQSDLVQEETTDPRLLEPAFSPTDLVSNLSFAEAHEQIEVTDEGRCLKQTITTCHSLLAYCRQAYQSWTCPEAPISEDFSRVRWRCACGEKLYDDYKELKPGAARRMEDYLRQISPESRVGNKSTTGVNISRLGQGLKIFVAAAVQRIRASNSNQHPVLVNTELRQYSKGRATRNPAHASGDIFYLLLCHNAGAGAESIKLRQPEICDIDNDQKNFGFLHEEYKILRKRWWSWISLWTLQSIKYVRFELHENELVDIKKLDEVPPPTKDNEYRHGPPNPPELIPPLGSTLLMHLFKHPELAGQRSQCLKKIPRKLQERLAIHEEGDTIGWGLQFIEGWSKKRLMYLTALTFGLSSLLVVILVSILGHNIQNAAAMASFMLSFATIGIATAQAALHLS